MLGPSARETLCAPFRSTVSVSPALWNSCTPAPLAFKAKCPGGSSSWRQTLRLSWKAIFFSLKIYLFISFTIYFWLRRVLVVAHVGSSLRHAGSFVVAHGLFVVACGLLCSCGMWVFSLVVVHGL